ncbi:MAG: hypothetical protein EHM39_11390 [Chloroflexi bacterium]|nr:MAG: hypothetical protein EHM39_11390 [Chloroflexota bacterium]
MAREPLERLLEDVTDEELESLRDAILREEGRRRVQLNLQIDTPFPPLEADEERDATITRWAKLITWLAKDAGFPPAEHKRAVSIRLVSPGGDQPPDPQAAGILLQQALVEAGLLLGRTPEWMDATTTQIEPGESRAVLIQMWDKPAVVPWK